MGIGSFNFAEDIVGSKELVRQKISTNPKKIRTPLSLEAEVLEASFSEITSEETNVNHDGSLATKITKVERTSYIKCKSLKIKSNQSTESHKKEFQHLNKLNGRGLDNKESERRKDLKIRKPWNSLSSGQIESRKMEASVEIDSNWLEFVMCIFVFIAVIMVFSFWSKGGKKRMW